MNSIMEKQDLGKRGKEGGGTIGYLQANPSYYSFTETMKNESKLNTLSCPLSCICARDIWGL